MCRHVLLSRRDGLAVIVSDHLAVFFFSLTAPVSASFPFSPVSFSRRASQPRPDRRRRSVRGEGGSGGGPERRRETRAQPRAAPRLHRRVSGPGLRVHAAGGPDRQLSRAQRRGSVPAPHW